MIANVIVQADSEQLEARTGERDLAPRELADAQPQLAEVQAAHDALLVRSLVAASFAAAQVGQA